MAKFKFRYGTMKSGKSQELIRVYYNYFLKGEQVLVMTSGIDNRAGVGMVSSRAGGQINALPVETLDDLKAITPKIEEYVCILIDEVQFLTHDMIKYIKEEYVIKRDIPVIAYGLKTDFMNNLFEGTQACIIYAEEIKEVETVCQYCNKRATMNLRLKNGVPERTGEQVLIGDSEYIQVCNYHWNNYGNEKDDE